MRPHEQSPVFLRAPFVQTKLTELLNKADVYTGLRFFLKVTLL